MQWEFRVSNYFQLFHRIIVGCDIPVSLNSLTYLCTWLLIIWSPMPFRPLLLKVLGSEARLRILLVLARNRGEDLTIYKIAKFSGLDRKVIRKHLSQLLAANLIRMKNYGPVCVYNINSDNAPVQRIIDLFNEARLMAQVPVQLHWYDIRAWNRFFQSLSSSHHDTVDYWRNKLRRFVGRRRIKGCLTKSIAFWPLAWWVRLQDRVILASEVLLKFQAYHGLKLSLGPCLTWWG